MPNHADRYWTTPTFPAWEPLTLSPKLHLGLQPHLSFAKVSLVLPSPSEAHDPLKVSAADPEEAGTGDKQ
jgi:hypothetical protein